MEMVVDLTCLISFPKPTLVQKNQQQTLTQGKTKCAYTMCIFIPTRTLVTKSKESRQYSWASLPLACCKTFQYRATWQYLLR